MGLFFTASMCRQVPWPDLGLSVGLEGHFYRKMVTDGKGLEGEGSKLQRPCWAASGSTWDGAHWVSTNYCIFREGPARPTLSTPAAHTSGRTWAGDPLRERQRASDPAIPGLLIQPELNHYGLF